MTWNVTLWCNQCQRNVGSMDHVTTQGRSGRPGESMTTMFFLQSTLREHEVNEHGGKS